MLSYLAIARKYRPATFADIVGQEHVVRTLSNALRSGRVHHAFLFCGARGVGKTTAARALAKSLNCLASEGPTPEPCGKCSSCVEIAAGSSPDLIEIDGASNNSVDDVRSLRETVGYAPTRGRYKVYLVDEVHMLSKAAFNALLKTLEEPPPHVVFVFATTEPNRIPDTILSRVQRFDFKRIAAPAVAQRLGEIAASEGAALSDAALRMIARAGDGSMRDAQSLLDKVISVGAAGEALTDAAVADTLGLVDRSLLFDFLEGLVRGEPAKCLEVVARVYDFGYELSEFTGDLLELLRNATFVRLSQEARAWVDASEDEVARLQALVADVPAESLTRTFNALLDTHDQVSRASRPRIVLEMAVARLATTRPVEPVAALLARLEELERRVRTPAAGAVRPNRPASREVRLPAAKAEKVAAPKAKAEAPKPAPPKPAPPKPAARKPAPKRAPEPPPDEGPPPIEPDAVEPARAPKRAARAAPRSEPEGPPPIEPDALSDRPSRSGELGARWSEVA
ncbi:MAG: DNA polymerase III subunit gamma/tau, partial [Myxococcota bacterium]